MRKKLSFAVVLPMYNEEKCAERAIRSIFPYLDNLPHKTSILVVNDGSRDRTGAIVQRLQKEYSRLTLLTHTVNRGYGGAIKTAYAHAVDKRLDYVLIMDSDLTQHPKYIARFVPWMEDGHGVIKASRYIPGGGGIGIPAYRVVLSRMGNWVARFLYGLPIHDFTNGFRAMKTDLVRGMDLHANGFDILMEELYQAKFLGASFGEVPYLLTARCEGDGVSTFSYRPRVLCRYLRFALLSFLKIRPAHLTRPVAPVERERSMRRAA